MKSLFSKIIAPILIVATLSSGFYFAAPKRAEAALVVPVLDNINAAFNNATQAGTWSDFGQKLLEWAMDLATSFLRRTLLSWIQDAIISAVQGNGVPKLVVNWGDLFEEATAGVQDAFIQRLGLQDFCSPFGIELQQILVNISLPRYTPETFRRGNYCTLKDILGNTRNALENFADDFKSGGFIALEQSWSPDSNFAIQVIRNQDELMVEEGFNFFNTFTEVGIAGQGFKDTKECPDGPESCRTKTVGKTTGDLVGKAAGADIDFILASERLTEVLTSAATLLVSTIIEQGLTQVSGLFNPADRERAFAEVNNINNQSFDSYKSSTIDAIDKAIQIRNETTNVLAGNISSLQSYKNRLTGYLNEINTKLNSNNATAGLPNVGATYCNAGFFNNVNIIQLKSDLNTEIAWATNSIAAIQTQSTENSQAIINLNVRKSEIQGLTNNTSGQLALSRIRNEIVADISAGTIEAAKFTAEVNADDDLARIDDQLNRAQSGSDPGGFNAIMPDFRNCTAFF